MSRAYAPIRRKPDDGCDSCTRHRRGVKEQAIHRARAGRIEIPRREQGVDGGGVDRDEFKDVWFRGVRRVRLKR